jgi:hypothetical protein
VTDARDQAADRNDLSFLSKRFLEDAFLEGLNLDIRLVGFNFGDRLTTVHVVARVLEPAKERSLLHVGTHLGHRDVGRALGRHEKSPPKQSSSVAVT